MTKGKKPGKRQLGNGSPNMKWKMNSSFHQEGTKQHMVNRGLWEKTQTLKISVLHSAVGIVKALYDCCVVVFVNRLHLQLFISWKFALRLHQQELLSEIKSAHWFQCQQQFEPLAYFKQKQPVSAAHNAVSRPSSLDFHILFWTCFATWNYEPLAPRLHGPVSRILQQLVWKHSEGHTFHTFML